MMHGPLLPKGTPPEEEPTEELEMLDKVEHPVDGSPSHQPATVTVANLFRHPDAHPVVLDLLLLKHYGPDWLVWEPETLELMLQSDFNNVSAVNLTKAQACKSLHLVDDFWRRWEVFNWITMGLNGVFPDAQILQVPTVAQVMIAVDAARQIRDDVQWSEEVRVFIESVHLHDGIVVAQPPLEFVRVPAEGYPVDADFIRRTWPDYILSNKTPSGGAVELEQLRRMKMAHQALEESRSFLRSQLPLVSHVPPR